MTSLIFYHFFFSFTPILFPFTPPAPKMKDPAHPLSITNFSSLRNEFLFQNISMLFIIFVENFQTQI